jgi:ATP-dependent DNA helicase RecG
VARFLDGLPYELTMAQRQALAVIVADMAGPFPMHRLLQGDVGSGKTVVAVAALLAAVQGGHQGALMVPTEVLAEQHISAVRALLGDLEGPGGMGGGDVRVELLTSRVKGKARAAVLGGLASGDVGIVVGTHALLTEEVSFASLGAVVIDEQHRFGVEQRATLRAKGADGPGDPDLLVMTATPIPRTAAMVIFGDLDLTTLDELPPGRIPVTTEWLPAAGAGPRGGGATSRDPHAHERPAWDRVRSEAAAGHRAFVVCPLVGDSMRVEAKSATEEFERLSAGELDGLRVGLVHGQMAAAQREDTMNRFRSGELEVLVATTVIEVGVDVPEATVMVVESADRFGIAQLHQLRGRVGRGSAASWCYLLGGEADNERLAAVTASTDGFALAEADLRLRGEGTLLGARQKGQSDLRLASLTEPRDLHLLDEARRVAAALVDEDPVLAAHPDLVDEVKLLLSEDEGEYLFKS